MNTCHDCKLPVVEVSLDALTEALVLPGGMVELVPHDPRLPGRPGYRLCLACRLDARLDLTGAWESIGGGVDVVAPDVWAALQRLSRAAESPEDREKVSSLVQRWELFYAS